MILNDPDFGSLIIDISYQAYLSQPKDPETGHPRIEAPAFAKKARQWVFANLDRHSKYYARDNETDPVSDVPESPLVDSCLINNNIAYLKLRSFEKEKSTNAMRNSINALRSKSPKMYILDLRDNRGGYLAEASEIADMFLDDGLIYKEVERERDKNEENAVYADDIDLIEGAPLAVLVNENSASASELVAAALKENGRATVFGQTTFGKGTIHNVFELSEGVTFTVTHAYYFGPHNYSVQNVGLPPDIVVTDDFNDVSTGALSSRVQSNLENPLDHDAYPDKSTQSCHAGIHLSQHGNVYNMSNQPERDDLTLQCAIDYLSGQHITTRFTHIYDHDDISQDQPYDHYRGIELSSNTIIPD